MQILLTGAEILEINDQYDVVYEGRIVKRKMIFEEALELALDEEKLRKLVYSNVYRLRTA
jgi:response regulator RpfG family c-di-GMP phosphodiesterase